MRIQFHRQARETPDRIGGLAVPYAAAKRQAPKWRWYLILLTVLSPVLILLLGLLGGFITRSANGAVTLDQLEVRASSSGRVLRMALEPGANVREGDLVARIEDLRALTTGGAGSQRNESHSRGLNSLEAGAELALRARALRLAQERRDSMAALQQAGAATHAELREAEGALDQTASALLRARHDLGLAATGDSVGGRPNATGASIVYENRSPTAGRVLDIFRSEGEIVAAGDPLVLIGRDSDPKVTAYVSPKFAATIRSGAKATIRFADGSKAAAEISEPARVTRRMPADLVDPFGMRPMMVVLKLQAASEWPASQAIHGLPVRVRFHYAWESTGPGSLLTRMLDMMAGRP